MAEPWKPPPNTATSNAGNRGRVRTSKPRRKGITSGNTATSNAANRGNVPVGSRPTPSRGRPTASRGASVYAIQEQLREAGYRVAQTGAWNGQTRSAWNWFNKGKGAEGWNSRWYSKPAKPRGNKPPPNPFAGIVNDPWSLAPPGGDTESVGSVSDADLPDYYAGLKPGNPMSFFKNLQKFLINPQAYANSVVGGLDRAIEQNRREAPSHLQDIDKWYGQVMQTQAEGAQRVREQDPLTILRSANTMGNVAAGDPTLQRVADLYTTAASGQSQSQQAFDNRMATILQAEAAESKTNEQVRMDNLWNELIGQRTDRYGQALQEATGQRFNQGLGLANAQMAAQSQMFGQGLGLANARTGRLGLGAEIEGRTLDNAGKRAGLNPNSWQNNEARYWRGQEASLQREQLNAQISQWMAEQEGDPKNLRGWAAISSDPAKLSALQDYYIGADGIFATGPYADIRHMTGKPRVQGQRLKTAWVRMANNLRAMGINPKKKEVRRFMQSTLSQIAPNGWTFGPNGPARRRRG